VYPNITLVVFLQAVNTVVGNGAGHAIGCKNLESVAVIAIQTTRSGNPQKALRIFHYAVYVVRRKTVFKTEMSEFYFLICNMI
jgi:aldehyde:ferredoxin oxidoreductase